MIGQQAHDSDQDVLPTDGECYAGTGLKECVKQGVQWDGCPAGKMRCKSDKRRCAASVAECQDKTGCPSGSHLSQLARARPIPRSVHAKFETGAEARECVCCALHTHTCYAGMQMCGVKRDKGTGKALFDTTTRKLQVRCMANCTLALERKPKDKKQALNSATGGQLTAETEDGKKAMRMKIRPKNFKGGDRAVNFTIKAVPDSLMQEGAFKTFHESGSLMGSLIQIEPSEYVEIEGQLPCLLTVITVMEQHQSAERADRESRAERERERERERDRQTDRDRPLCTLGAPSQLPVIRSPRTTPLPGKRPGAVS